MLHAATSRSLTCLTGWPGFAALLLAACGSAPYTVEERVNPDTGLSSWKAEHTDFSIELIQVVPDYVRATYASRGLSEQLAERMASWCVLGTVLRNTSDTSLSWALTDWSYRAADGLQRHPKLKSAWLAEWREAGIPFKWTLLPDAQTFAVGDWIQGFTTYDLRPGETFDLVYSWTRQGKTRTGTIEGVRCALDE
jgi:hypothetical protein